MAGATVDATAVAAEIGASLTLDEIPVKLRCAGCNKLALNAFRMPCCDQSLCEPCQDSLESFCPICLHEPVQKQDCKPNKTLRQTIKAFLRKKGIERETARKKERVASLPQPSTTPAPFETTYGIASQPRMDTHGSTGQSTDPIRDTPQETPQPPLTISAQDSSGVIQRTTSESQMDIPRPSIETSFESNQNEKVQASSSNSEQDSKGQDQNGGGADQIGQNGGRQDQSGQWLNNAGAGQNMPAGAAAFDGMSGGFPNMGGFPGAGDFSQMMQLMPNAMPNTLMGAFPNMMGMPGMMDPMAISQAMYGGFGGPGIGMNGMNGMNVGVGFNAGQGAFGGFNGQADTWNTGQDKFNPNAYGHADGMGGDFGAHTGYGGYNMPSHQGNFNQMNHQQFPNNDFQHGYSGHGFQNRGRGRRGGFNNNGRGRGGYNQVSQGNYGNQANYEPFHHQIPTHMVQQSSSQPPKSEQPRNKEIDHLSKKPDQNSHLEASATAQVADEQMNKEPNIEDTDDKPRVDIVIPQSNVTTKPELKPSELKTKSEKSASPRPEQGETILKAEDSMTSPIETFISTENARGKKYETESVANAETSTMPPPSPAIPLGPAAHYVQEHSLDSSGRGRGSGRGYYRGHTDIRGGYRGRGTGYLPHGAVSSPTQTAITNNIPPMAPVEPKGLGVEGAPKGPKALREGLPNTSLRGGRGFSIVGRASTIAQAKPNGPVRASSRSPSHRRSRSPSRSRSTSRHRSGRHRSHRHRSKSDSDEAERERRRERHRRRSRKYEEEDQNGVDGHDESRKRDPSLESSSKRSSHRAHRNREHENSSSSHRHHRERSKERDDERRHRRKRSRSPTTTSVAPTAPSTEAPPLSPVISRHQDKERSRKRRDRDEDDRNYDRKRSRRDRSASQEEKENHRSSRRDKRDRDEPETSTSNHHSNPKRTSTIEKDHDKSSTQSTTVQPPEKDHHTLEREARNRERLMKELQRREANEGKGVSKRRASGAGGVPGRRVSYKYEDEENEEVRVGRVENEREAGRWM